MKVAFLTTDSREHYKEYGRREPYFGTAPEALLQGFAKSPGVEVHVVCCLRETVTSPEKLAPNIYYHALRVPKAGWMTTGYQGCIRAVRSLMKTIRPDIVHGQGTERDCALSAIFSGCANVITIHGNMRLIARVTAAQPLSFPWLAARLERLTIPRADGVVCITNYTREAVGPLARRTWVVPNAVHESFFQLKAEPAQGPPQILSVGLICPRKNQCALIQALDTIAGRTPFQVLFLGGVSPGRAYDDEFLKLVAARPWCRHGGFADRARLQDELKRSRLLALPSLEDNCPMAVLEAMAGGVPVVAAKVGGLPDLVQEGCTGFFCNPYENASMAGAVERGLSETAQGVAVATAARNYAHENFHPARVASRHIAIYQELLSKAS